MRLAKAIDVKAKGSKEAPHARLFVAPGSHDDEEAGEMKGKKEKKDKKHKKGADAGGKHGKKDKKHKKLKHV